MTLAGANALIGSMYGDADNLETAPMDQAVVDAIRYAYDLLIFRRENPEHTWAEQRPADCEAIEAFSVPMDIWIYGTYLNDGVDGLIEWEDASLCEIEEYGQDTITKWRKAYVQPETIPA